jgi:imidazolonepropionase-like amidohydrolase
MQENSSATFYTGRTTHGRMVGRIVGVVAAICSSLVIAAAMPSQPPRRNAFVIRNLRIFDGERVIEANSVAVEDGKIVAVGTNIASPLDAQVIDGSGDTLLPGLIDSHVHAWIREVLEMGLVMGVTTELDMYMRWEDALKWRAEESNGASDIADFRTAGTAIAVAGGHGTESDLPRITPIRRPDQAQAFVAERIAHGSDYIKVFYDNGPRFAAMSKETLAAIVKAAHARHKMVIVHVASAQGYLDVIDTGADGLAHVPIVKLPEPAFRNAAMAHHIFAITTLGFTDFFFGSGRLWSKLPKDPSIAPYLGPLARRDLQQPRYNSPEHISYADNEADLRMLRDAGVPLLAGTDANGAQAGAIFHTELELMVKAGLTPSETLADATSVPAKVFSLDDRGRVAPGMRVDLLLVHGDPTKDIRATRDIVAVWKQGVRVDRESRRKVVAQRNEAWRFGAGWLPWTDSIFKGNSKVLVSTVEGGPNHAPTTMIVRGKVNSGIEYPWAGVAYFPGQSYRMANGDISGRPQISFWTKGDGKTYKVMLFQGDGTPSTTYFLTTSDWTLVVIPFSEFASEGRDVYEILFKSSAPGDFRFELSDEHPGARRWLGVELSNPPKVQVVEVHRDSPAQKAGLRVGDTIGVFNGKPVESHKDVLRLLSETRIHDKVPIEGGA